MSRPLRAPLTATLALLLLAGSTAACAKTSESTATNDPDVSTPATAANGTPTFGLPKDPSAAIKESGLPAMPTEGTGVHYHAHLDVSVDGHAVTVPALIGIDEKAQRISPLHTHTDDGIVHIEAEKADTFTVGQLFTEWGVKLDKSCIATYCMDGQNQLLSFLNGQLVGDPASVPFAEHDEIVIWYGPRGTNPSVPTTYTFTNGL